MSLRGGNPTETGVYLDGHPIPRAFHVVPIASVLSPPLTDRVEISPGNYGPQFGSFGAGLVEIYSRAGRRDGIHGETHLDLFDLGSTLEAPVGAGSVHFGVRRSHVDGVLLGVERAVGDTGILFPNYWDYLGRFDYPIQGGHRITVRALGAGDRLRARGEGP
ncbi:MAG TPA: TonB-dependent receptor, partial [Enhygromyxa sp.]|nr:TonB-dependent receptor [Enhygromyxa sp.]